MSRVVLFAVLAACSPMIAAPVVTTQRLRAAQAGITGQLRDGAGQAIRGATIIASPSPPATESQTIVSDNGGAFALGLAPGPYDVTVYYANEVHALGDVAVVAGTETKIDVVIDTSHALARDLP